MKIKRMWINQPSKLQMDHRLHGVLVLAAPSYFDMSMTCYFLSGPVVCSEILKSSLSIGWPAHLR